MDTDYTVSWLKCPVCAREGPEQHISTATQRECRDCGTVFPLPNATPKIVAARPSPIATGPVLTDWKPEWGKDTWQWGDGRES